MARDGGKPSRRKPGAARTKFSTPSEARVQLEGITAAQEQYRRAKRNRDEQTGGPTEDDKAGPIVDSREKSEQAYRNALRGVRRPEDLDDFD